MVLLLTTSNWKGKLDGLTSTRVNSILCARQATNENLNSNECFFSFAFCLSVSAIATTGLRARYVRHLISFLFYCLPFYFVVAWSTIVCSGMKLSSYTQKLNFQGIWCINKWKKKFLSKIKNFLGYFVRFNWMNVGNYFIYFVKFFQF